MRVMILGNHLVLDLSLAEGGYQVRVIVMVGVNGAQSLHSNVDQHKLIHGEIFPCLRKLAVVACPTTISLGCKTCHLVVWEIVQDDEQVEPPRALASPMLRVVHKAVIPTS